MAEIRRQELDRRGRDHRLRRGGPARLPGLGDARAPRPTPTPTPSPCPPGRGGGPAGGGHPPGAAPGGGHLPRRSRPSTPTPTTSGCTRSRWPPWTPPATPTRYPEAGQPFSPLKLYYTVWSREAGCGPCTRSSWSSGWSRRSTTSGWPGCQRDEPVTTSVDMTGYDDVRADAPAGPRHPGGPDLAHSGSACRPRSRRRHPPLRRLPAGPQPGGADRRDRGRPVRRRARGRLSRLSLRRRGPGRAAAGSRSRVTPASSASSRRSGPACADQPVVVDPGLPVGGERPQLGAVDGRVQVHLGHPRLRASQVVLEHWRVPTPGTNEQLGR